MNKQLSVRLNGKTVGILEQDEHGKLNFKYEQDAKQVLSNSLPIQEETFGDEICRAYFGGLLPESEDSRKYIAKRHHISAKNEFSMLKAIGHDCAGAVSFHTLDEPEEEADFVELTGESISDEELAQHIKELPKKPLFTGIKDFRLSLAGVQDKAAVCLIDGEICLPKKNCPTTHILKPIIPKLAESIENEYLCLKVAGAIGIEVPNVEIKKAVDMQYLLIERYDRKIKDNKIKRVHQEDFCQALGKNSLNKYQSEGGPNLVDCFNLLKKVSTRPGIDRNKLTERIIFNYLIGNTDAHSKNFSLLRYENNSVQLAPMYDVLCAPVYDELTEKMAMKIGGYYEFNKIYPRHWKKFCEEAGLSFPQFRMLFLKRACYLSDYIESEIEKMKELGLKTDIAKKILDFASKNCETTINRFSSDPIY